MSLAVRIQENLSRSERGVGGRARDQSWSEMKSWPNLCQMKNILVCDDEMMMFEGGDRLEKSEGMELTRCEEYDMMLEYVC